jgi:enoyl-CoA hydratase/carnithine racemase
MNPSGRVRAIASHLLPSAVAGEAPTLISETPNVKVERQGRVVIITLVQTKTLNSLSRPLKNDLKAALAAADADQNTGCIILTGSGKAFIAGADIKEMNEMGLVEITQEDLSVSLQPVSTCQVPIIAAVNGFAFGGGCEIAMMCDIIVASDKAVFGQPEIKLGVIPGGGGTQRLIRQVGKSKAMALILTGRNMSAEEAEKAGLAAAVVKHEELMPYCMKMADEIANMGRVSTVLAKEATNAAYETPLAAGVDVEKRMFYSLFATQDKKEGMDAFVKKRKAAFTHK